MHILGKTTLSPTFMRVNSQSTVKPTSTPNSTSNRKKAKHFKDSTTIQQILAAKSGLDCKRLSKNIKNYRHDEWVRVAKGLSEPGIIAKFNQNPQLIELLMKTDNKLIVESSRDPVWGTGVPIHDLDVLARDKWKR